MGFDTEPVLDSSTKLKYMTENFMYIIIKKLNLLQLSKFQGTIDNQEYERTKEQFLQEFKDLAMTDASFKLENFIEVT